MAHRFGADRPLVLGGVAVPHDQGLLAHSDGDVLIHALCDALLGAAALGDIGRHFPDTDPALRRDRQPDPAAARGDGARRAGLRVVNADLTVVAQRPRLAAHIPAMQANLARDLGVGAGQVNVKATTTEGMGFTGRGGGHCRLRGRPARD